MRIQCGGPTPVRLLVIDWSYRRTRPFNTGPRGPSPPNIRAAPVLGGRNYSACQCPFHSFVVHFTGAAVSYPTTANNSSSIFQNTIKTLFYSSSRLLLLILLVQLRKFTVGIFGKMKYYSAARDACSLPHFCAADDEAFIPGKYSAL